MNFFDAHRAFMERLEKAQPLTKSIAPSDFDKMVRAVDPQGSSWVDHTGHMTSHPASINSDVQAFKEASSGQSPILSRTPVALQGISRKLVYSLPKPGHPSQSKQIMLKPYHEKVLKALHDWQLYPIQGWAEMTNQAMFHAAQMGLAHQLVHVSEHDMGSRQNEPALGIHMEKDTIPSHHLKLEDFVNYHGHSMRKDGVKIGVLDFLANNLDRHPNNLLVRPFEGKDEHGMPHAGHLLAIDHGRNFQYVAAHKGNKYMIKNGQRVAIPESQRPSMLEDNLMYYLRRHGLMALDRHFYALGEPLIQGNHFVHHVADWWPKVRDAVRGELYHHVMHLKNPKFREHVINNFEERANLLDRISADPVSHMVNRKLLTVPIHPYKP